MSVTVNAPDAAEPRLLRVKTPGEDTPTLPRKSNRVHGADGQKWAGARVDADAGDDAFSGAAAPASAAPPADDLTSGTAGADGASSTTGRSARSAAEARLSTAAGTA